MRDTPAKQITEIGTRPLASPGPRDHVVPIGAARPARLTLPPETAAGHIRNAMTILRLSGEAIAGGRLVYTPEQIDAAVDRLARALERMGVSQ